MMRRPPRSTLVPYTTLVRSDRERPPAGDVGVGGVAQGLERRLGGVGPVGDGQGRDVVRDPLQHLEQQRQHRLRDRKSTRLNSSHANISYAVFSLENKLRLYA